MFKPIESVKFNILAVTTVAVFHHLGGDEVFHHDRPAFSVSGHLWVDAIYVHVPLRSVDQAISSLDVLLVLFPSPSYLMWVFSLRTTCPYDENRFCVRTDSIGATFLSLIYNW